MSVREVFGCFGDNCPDKHAEKPHRDFNLRPFGVGYVHEECRDLSLGPDGLQDRPLCTLSHVDHYVPTGRDGLRYPVRNVDDLPRAAGGLRG